MQSYFELICRDIQHLIEGYLKPPHSPCLAMCEHDRIMLDTLANRRRWVDEPIQSTSHIFAFSFGFITLLILGPTVEAWKRPREEWETSEGWQSFCQNALVVEMTSEHRILSGPIPIRDYFARHYDIHQLALQADPEWANVK